MARFPADCRVLRRRDFELAYREGGRFGGKFVAIVARPNLSGHGRIGVAVSRRVGGAVVRNHWKRRLREIFRNNVSHRGMALDFVFTVRSSVSEPGFAELRAEVLLGMERLSRRLTRP